jgi:hypothetical protein
MTALEQAQSARQRRMSEVLWDLFTGSAPYRDVFLRTLHPVYIKDLVWNLIAGNASRGGKPEDKVGQAGGGRHDTH